jgi:hypothetical protein
MGKASKQIAAMSEMAIVDVFTRLIFDADARLNKSERMIIELLCLHESTLVGAARRDISEFLRAMTIEEMTAVVNQLKTRFDQQQGLIAASNTALHRSMHH